MSMKGMEQPIDMKSVETAKDMMMKGMEQSLSKIRAGKDILVERIIWREQLKGSSDYSFCPYCRERAKRSAGANWKTQLHPLWYAKYQLLVRIDEKRGRWIPENRYECPVCKSIDGKPRTITEDDFLACRTVEANYAKSDIDISNVDFSNPSERAFFIAGV